MIISDVIFTNCLLAQRFRLSGGTSSKGKLEIHIDGKWGAMCRAEWDDYRATVACWHLGYQ